MKERLQATPEALLRLPWYQREDRTACRHKFTMEQGAKGQCKVVLKDGSSAGLPLAETLAVNRPRRQASNVSYSNQGKVVATLCQDPQPSPPPDDECLREGVAVMLLQERQARSELLLGNVPSERADLDTTVELIDMSFFEYDIQHQVYTSTRAVMLIANNTSVPVHLDTTKASTWHVPKTYKDYLNSPQRSLWRTAKELKMDEYKAIPLFELVCLQAVLDAGHVVLNTLWAYDIKYVGVLKDIFSKLNPRWCLMGGPMDRNVHESYADVCKWTTILVIANIRCHYNCVDFQFDVSNAFQNTEREIIAYKKGDTPPKAVYCYQAAGFTETGSNAERLCCMLLMVMQGAIDASRLFGTAFGKTLMERAGCRRMLWDNEAWEYHHGPLSATAASLEEILDSVSDLPAAPGAPPGWAVFGRHVDDGFGVASSQRISAYLINQIAIDWSIKNSGWTKFLGYGFRLSACGHYCEISCFPVIEKLFREMCGDDNTYNPKHPYPMNIKDLKPGVRPAEDSPERPAFDAMQTKQRSGLGVSIWASRVHLTHTLSTNLLCGSMSNPSFEQHRAYKHTVMHLKHHPCPLVVGSGRLATLTCLPAPPVPLSGGTVRELGLLVCVDSDLGAPRQVEVGTHEPAIAEGLTRIHETSNSKSISGIAICLGGVACQLLCLRQHLTAPDSTAAEVSAAGTAVNLTVPIDGLLREWHINNTDVPVPIFCDSQSTIFISKAVTSIRRTVWLERRAIVLREYVDSREFIFIKIAGELNIADGLTKPMTQATYKLHLSYSHPYAGLSDEERQVVSDTFHRLAKMPFA